MSLTDILDDDDEAKKVRQTRSRQTLCGCKCIFLPAL